jgi:hypothetical protein
LACQLAPIPDQRYLLVSVIAAENENFRAYLVVRQLREDERESTPLRTTIIALRVTMAVSTKALGPLAPGRRQLTARGH